MSRYYTGRVQWGDDDHEQSEHEHWCVSNQVLHRDLYN